MSSKYAKKRTLAGASLVTAGLALSFLTACAPAEEPTPQVAESAADPELAALLPQEYADAGVIVFGTTKSNPPWGVYDVNTEEFSGFEPALQRELASRLGVEAQIEGTEYSGLQTGLLAGQYDVMISSMHDTVEREAQMDFLDYARVGSAFVTVEGNPASIETLSDACGKTVIVNPSSVQLAVLEAYQEECEAEGGGAIEMVNLPDQAAALVSLSAGGADAFFGDKAALSYLVTQDTATPLEMVSDDTAGIEPGYVGMAVVKQNRDLLDALQASLQSMIDDGTYAEILEEHDFTFAAVDEAHINGASLDQ
jgi:polar amino acid transport system substrate-binding protein